ncbi:MAG: hypothetical protein RL684_1553 [Pseudomonadota bacterium]
MTRAPLKSICTALAAGTLLTLAACGGSDTPSISFTPFEANFGLVVADVNGDGFPDVVSGRTLHQPVAPGESGALYTALHNNTAGGGYAAETHVASGTEPLYLASADLDADALSDVVSADFDAGVLLVYLNSSAQPGQWAMPVSLAAPGVSQVAIGDLNGDGKPDLVAADFAVDVFLQDPAMAGHFLAPSGLNAGGANWVAIGDVNHDGLPDVLVTDATGVKVYLHAADPASATFLPPVTVFTQTPNVAFSGANYVAIADVNGDGYADLVITDPGTYGPTPPTVNVLLQDAAAPGTFLAAAAYPVSQGRVAQAIMVADVNGDGLPDILYGDSAGVSVLLQNGAAAGTFAMAVTYAAPYGAFQLGLADVDGDGLVDIVVSNSTTLTSVGGVDTTRPGVLLQDPAAHGSFKPLQNLP